MVHGTFATNFVRENFRNMCHLWQRDGTRTWFIGLTGSFVVMSAASKLGASETHESRIGSSKHYRLNFSEKYDHPVYRLPPRADAHHGSGAHKPEAHPPH